MYWLRRLFRKKQTERQLDSELRFHLEQRTAELADAGMAPEEARRRARLEFGGVEGIKEECRESRRVHFFEVLLQDVKYGIRTMRRSPGFAIVAVLTLALGIGANTAIFSVVNAVLLRPLPFADPARLVQVWHVPPARSFPGLTRFAVSAANYLDWRAQSRTFEDMAIYTAASFTLTGQGDAESLTSVPISPNLFNVLGAQPVLGRAFAPDEDQPGRSNVAILTYAFWQTRFGADKNIIGQNITLNRESYRVIGVMGPTIHFPALGQKIWTPLAWTDKEKAVRGEHHFGVIARVRKGFQLEQAQAEMEAISRRLAQQYPEDDAGWGAVVVPLRDELVGDVRPSLLILLGAVAFVLLIACANVANLILARSLSQRKEVAIRSALGASSRRVLQQVLIETTVLALAGGLAGILVASLSTSLIVHFLAQKLPRAVEIGLDARVLAFTFAISICTGILAGLVPAWRLIKTDINETLKQASDRASTDPGGNRARSVLVGAEVALALVLLIGAGLMIRSLSLLRHVDPGFDVHEAIAMSLPVAQTRYLQPQQQAAFFNQVLDRVRSLPGVEAAAVIDDLPMHGNGSHQPVTIEGRPAAPMSEQPEVDARCISTGYLSAMHIPLLRGRDLAESDNADASGVVLISQSMATRFWPNEDPIGKRVVLSFFPDKSREIVGIVGDVKQDALDDAAPSETLYTPLNQLSVPLMGGWRSFGMTLVIRTTSEPSRIISTLTRAVHEVDAGQPVIEATSLEQFVGETLSQQRFNMLMLAVFAGMALFLATVGIYSLLSYAVRRRVREIGIRMALGAQPGDVLRLVIGEGAKLAVSGVAVGLLIAFGLTRLLAGLLFGVKPTDPLTFVCVALLLCFVALLACYVPARRAMRTDPMMALRSE
jgi:putative ABC transport system permease protein